MKPFVIASIEDETGDRCVDIIRHPVGRYSFGECRRDPEDSHGWRHLSGAEGPTFPSRAEAEAAAEQSVGWLREMRSR